MAQAQVRVLELAQQPAQVLQAHSPVELHSLQHHS
jgi:hypothetical protein